MQRLLFLFFFSTTIAACGGQSGETSVTNSAAENYSIVSDDATANEIVPGVRNKGRYGYEFGEVDLNEVMFSFEGCGDKATIDVRGYDIDKNEKVEVLVNGDGVGFLSRSKGNKKLNNGDSFRISINASQNTLTFRQLNNGEPWGVTNLLLTDCESKENFTRIDDTKSTAKYGYGYGAGINHIEENFAFESPGSLMSLEVSGYDINSTYEVSVSLNDKYIGHLSVGKKKKLNSGDVFILSAEDQIEGLNVVTFRQRKQDEAWGVTNLSLTQLAPVPEIGVPEVVNTEVEVSEVDTAEVVTDADTTESETNTTEAVSSESDSTEPNITELDSSESDATESITTELDASESDANESITTQIDTSESDVSESTTTELDTSESDASESITTELNTSESDASESNTTELDTSESDVNELDTTELDMSDSDASESNTTESEAIEQVTNIISHPECQSAESDTDGDGYGWENNASCFVVNNTVTIESEETSTTETEIETINTSSTTYLPEDITDLILVTGQSNTLGSNTAVDDVLDKPHPRVFAYNSKGKSWQVAELYQKWDRGAHPGTGNRDLIYDRHNNFALHFAKHLAELDENAVVGFILVSEPGEGIENWNPGKNGMVRSLEKTVRAINELPHKSAIDGILWHQGETDWQLEGTSDVDVQQPAPINYYPMKLDTLIDNFRAQNWYDSTKPFICGETIRADGVNTHLMALNTDDDEKTGCVQGSDLVAINQNGSHFDSPSLRTLGKRYAEKYLELR